MYWFPPTFSSCDCKTVHENMKRNKDRRDVAVYNRELLTIMCVKQFNTVSHFAYLVRFILF